MINWLRLGPGVDQEAILALARGLGYRTEDYRDRGYVHISAPPRPTCTARPVPTIQPRRANPIRTRPFWEPEPPEAA